MSEKYRADGRVCVRRISGRRAEGLCIGRAGAVRRDIIDRREGKRLAGLEHKYIDLSSIHVSEDMRGSGIGRTLFEAAKIWSKDQGAGKLYISAHSAVESQAFYKKMGCREAELYHQGHVEAEPYDCQLECPV